MSAFSEFIPVAATLGGHLQSVSLDSDDETYNCTIAIARDIFIGRAFAMDNGLDRIASEFSRAAVAVEALLEDERTYGMGDGPEFADYVWNYMADSMVTDKDAVPLYVCLVFAAMSDAGGDVYGAKNYLVAVQESLRYTAQDAWRMAHPNGNGEPTGV